MKFEDYKDLRQYRIAIIVWGAGDKKELQPRLVMVGENLRGKNLTLAVLTNADLTFADLTGANLTLAVLKNATLTGATLTGATLTGARFDEKTTLPDGTRWTPDTDMTRFTKD